MIAWEWVLVGLVAVCAYLLWDIATHLRGLRNDIDTQKDPNQRR